MRKNSLFRPFRHLSWIFKQKSSRLFLQIEQTSVLYCPADWYYSSKKGHMVATFSFLETVLWFISWHMRVVYLIDHIIWFIKISCYSSSFCLIEGNIDDGAFLSPLKSFKYSCLSFLFRCQLKEACLTSNVSPFL